MKICQLLLFLFTLLSSTAQAEPHLHILGELPVLHEGRIKPLDTVARNTLLLLRGKQSFRHDGRTISAIEWLADTTMNTAKAAAYPAFRIDHPDVLTLLHKEADAGQYYTFKELEPHLEEVRERALKASQVEQRDSYQTAVMELWQKITLYLQLSHTLYISEAENPLHEITIFEQGVDVILPLMQQQQQPDLELFQWFVQRYQFMNAAALFAVIYPESTHEWVSMGEAILNRQKSTVYHPGVQDWVEMITAYRKNDNATFNASLHHYQSLLDSHEPQAVFRASIEAKFNRIQPFFLSILFYSVTFLLCLLSWMVRPKALEKVAWVILILAFLVHTVGLITRMWIEGRPPVTNLYSSAVFVGWAAVLCALILEKICRNGLAMMTASLVGGLTLIVAHHLAVTGDTMEMMRAVLNSNFWLGTHVVTITIGYSAAFLAGLLACCMIFRKRLGRSSDPKEMKTAASMIYGVICVSTLFSFVGTILGGIWADQSWGRFWGWDPKENGALLLVLWNAIILHAKWAGLIRARGVMIMAVGGNIVTSFSWFGVNLLGVGLHSYGFMDGTFHWLIAFMGSQVVIMMIGATLTERSPSKT